MKKVELTVEETKRKGDRYETPLWIWKIGDVECQTAAGPSDGEDIIEWLQTKLKDLEDTKASQAEMLTDNLELQRKVSVFMELVKKHLTPVQAHGIKLRMKLLNKSEEDALVDELEDK